MSGVARLGGPDGRPELLVLRALKLGDLLVAVPALRGLRHGFPEHRLILATPAWLSPLVALIDGVDALLPTIGLEEPLPLPPGRIEVAVNLHGRGPQSHARLDALGPHRRIGYAVPPEAAAPGSEWARSEWNGPTWPEEVHERARWAGLVQAYGHPADPDDVALARPTVPSPAPGAVVIHVGAFYGSRAWPVERFASVAATLAAAGEPVVLSGGAADRLRAEEVARRAGLADRAVLAGRTDLAQLAALVAEAAVLISVDTGAAHLASAYGTRSVVLFGPAPPAQWGPPRSGPHVVLTRADLRRGAAFSDEPDPALLGVSAADVLQAVIDVLAKPARG